MTAPDKFAHTDSSTEDPPMELNNPEVVAEVRTSFLRYQHAVDTNDVAVMNELFWTSPFTVRFGPNGTLIGHDAIANYRQTRATEAEPRALRNTVITTFGRDFAATNTETMKAGKSGIGRQSQTWIRTSWGWRIASAHVSEQPAVK
jgi:hypothetical protein